MGSELVIYCDESIHKGEFYSNFYGGLLIKSTHLDSTVKALEELKISLNLHKELKWERVTSNYLSKYITFIDKFFDYVERDIVKVRIKFSKNAALPYRLDAYQIEHSFFLLYYQFIKHAFGLHYCPYEKPINIKMFFDKLPDTHEKCSLFKANIQSLENAKAFKEAKVIVKLENIAEINSDKHVLSQCLDIILGSIQFKLNKKNLSKSTVTNKRGKRTIAKEKLYNHINKRIRKIHPNFNVGISTGLKGNYDNLWKYKYRHWSFKPKAKK